MARRTRLDTIKGAVDVMARAASVDLSPPVQMALDDEERLLFDGIVEERARSEWSPHQLVIAAQLARAMVDYDREARRLREEGGAVVGAEGRLVSNPRRSVVTLHLQAVMNFRRTLGLHARARGGDTDDIARRSKLAKVIEAGNSLNDELLAN